MILGATEHKQITSTERDLKQYVRKKKLDKVIQFMDNVINVEDYLGATDIFVFPTMAPEGMPNAVLEAMLCGLPVLCTDMPQIRCLFPEEEGYFFDPTDIESITELLIKFIDSKTDREEWGKKLLSHGRKQYSSDRYTEQYSRIFEQLVFNC